MGAIDREPVGVYAIAITYGYKDIGAKAAKSSFELSTFSAPDFTCAKLIRSGGTSQPWRMRRGSE